MKNSCWWTTRETTPHWHGFPITAVGVVETVKWTGPVERQRNIGTPSTSCRSTPAGIGSLPKNAPDKFVDYIAPESDNRVDPQKDVNVTGQRVEIVVQTKVPAGKNTHEGAFLLKRETHVYLP